jgi:hypothetical protein
MKNDLQSQDVYLSKSLFIKGLQCHKLLFLRKKCPELKDEISDSQEAIFAGGRDVGIMAWELFPGGVEIPYDGLSHQEQLDLTQQKINEGQKTIYEATFSHQGIFVKVDILHKGKTGWDIYEVKASTKVKDVHIEDVAVQYYVVSGTGLPVSRAYVVHINNKYVREGDIEVEKLFSKEDLTEEVENKQPFIKKEIEKQKQMLQGKEPVIGIGPHCDNPYTCDFHGHCWAHVPEDSVFTIRGKGVDRFSLYNDGYLSMYDVPKDRLKPDHIMQIESNREKLVKIDQKTIQAFLKTLKYPLAFFDFETFMTAIPPFDGIKPYQQIPFQYSLHILEKPEGKLQHYEFLAMPHQDPREDLVNNLVNQIPDKGSVLVYNKSFEIGILKNLAELFPQQKKKIERIISNVVDLMAPFKNRDVYHWQMNGSFSLKAVLPAMVPELSYEHLDVSDGGMAMEAYAVMNRTDDKEEIAHIRKSLLEYCQLDTLAMVEILKKLWQIR